MKIIDFFIGMTLMNAMLHSVLGYWKGRMLTSFGYGNVQNIAYGFLNFFISLGLYIYAYGFNAIFTNGMYLGSASLLVLVLLFGRFLHKIFNPTKS